MLRVILFLGVLMASICHAEVVHVDNENIEYSVRNANYNTALNKLSIDIEINLVNGRLPSANEIASISKVVLNSHPKANMNWLLYFLPKMPSDSGAFATDHRAPEPEGVKILPFMLYNTPYQKFIE